MIIWGQNAGRMGRRRAVLSPAGWPAVGLGGSAREVWLGWRGVTREEFLDLLARLRCAPVGRARLRAPHKPLLLLWLFGRFASTGSPAVRLGLAFSPKVPGTQNMRF